MKIIVGLGNPEDKYTGSRHNLGFDLLEHYRRRINAPRWSLEDKFRAQRSEVNSDLMLVRPQTFMNKSGLAVSKLAYYYKVNFEDIIVVHDDMDLPLGHIKVRLGGAGAGHHGVESVINELKTDQFIRVRLGIGNLRSQSGERGNHHFNAEEYVLSSFNPHEKSDVKKMLKKGINALEILLKEGLEKTQNQFN